jgi:hypothetical protein
MGAIRWPTGPFRVHRAGAGWFVVAAAWANILLAAGLLIWAAMSEPPRQLAANIVASLGIGQTVAGARAEQTDCSYWGGGRGGGVYHCDVTVVGPGLNEVIEIPSSRNLEEAAPPRIVTVLGRLAVGYSPTDLLTALLVPLIAVAALFGMIALGFYGLFGADLLNWRYRDARIVEVDLLRRKMLSAVLAEWDFAYDDTVGRRYLRGKVAKPPVIVDGVVTRGAALVRKDGKARLLTTDFWPLDIDPQKLEEVRADIEASFHAWRPALPERFGECVGEVAPGPEREFVESWRAIWDGKDVAVLYAAIEVRHAAALKLDPERVDALLRRCRGCRAA